MRSSFQLYISTHEAYSKLLLQLPHWTRIRLFHCVVCLPSLTVSPSCNKQQVAVLFLQRWIWNLSVAADDSTATKRDEWVTEQPGHRGSVWPFNPRHNATGPSWAELIQKYPSERTNALHDEDQQIKPCRSRQADKDHLFIARWPQLGT